MLRKTFVRLLGDERGVTLVEYGIGITLAVVVGTVALTQLGIGVDREMGAAEIILDGNDAATDYTTIDRTTAALQ